MSIKPEKSHRTIDKIAEKDRIPLREKFCYSSGILAFQICNNAIPQLAYPVFNILMGVPAAWVGGVLMAGRIWDAFTDPLMGSISDNARTRWGRRKPFILLGALLSALLYMLVWFVPESFGHVAATTWFLVTALMFFTSFTIFAVPYTSQGFELTPDSHERTRLMGVRAYFATCIGLIIPWIFAIAQWERFPSPIFGVRFLGFVIGGLIILSAIPTLFVTERFERRAGQQKKIPILWGIKETLRNRSFQTLVSLTVSVHMAMLIVNSLGFYVIIYHVFGGNVRTGSVYAGYAATVMTLCGLAAIPFVTRFSRRFGKVRTMSVIIILAIVADALKWFLYTPAHPRLFLIIPALIGTTGAGFWVLVNSMRADVPDDDEMKTGLRREGMFGAMDTWFQKFAMAFSFILTGMILSASGFDAEQGVQDDSTIVVIRLAFIALPALGNLISLTILQFYPLTEQRMQEIRAELESRRGKL